MKPEILKEMKHIKENCPQIFQVLKMFLQSDISKGDIVKTIEKIDGSLGNNLDYARPISWDRQAKQAGIEVQHYIWLNNTPMNIYTEYFMSLVGFFMDD